MKFWNKWGERMNTTQLECFVSLASTLNYTKTAEQVYLTQTAVTKQIQSLEAELGARLFVRSTRSVSLTPVGNQFLPEATAMLGAYYHAKGWISSFNAESKHSLRIGYSDPNALHFVSRVFASMKAASDSAFLLPQFSLAQNDANLALLSKGQLDVVVGMKDAKFKDEAVEFIKLSDMGFSVVMPKNHPVARVAKRKKLLEIPAELLWPHNQVIQMPPYLLKNVFSKSGSYLIPVNENAENCLCSYTTETYALLKAGFGFAFVPEYLAIPDDELVIFPFAETKRAPFGLYVRKDALKENSSIINSFVAAARAQS